MRPTRHGSQEGCWLSDALYLLTEATVRLIDTIRSKVEHEDIEGVSDGQRAQVAVQLNNASDLFWTYAKNTSLLSPPIPTDMGRRLDPLIKGKTVAWVLRRVRLNPDDVATTPFLLEFFQNRGVLYAFEAVRECKAMWNTVLHRGDQVELIEGTGVVNISPPSIKVHTGAELEANVKRALEDMEATVASWRRSQSAGNANTDEPASVRAEEVARILVASDQARVVVSRVPEQKIAPMQFEVRDNKISVAREKNFTEEEDRLNVAAAREELIEEGRELLQSLKGSNCDRRSIEVFSKLQKQLEADENIIRISMVSARFEALIPSLEEALATPVLLRLQVHARDIETYAAQFPNWQRYKDNDAELKLEPSDGDNLVVAAEQVLAELTANKEHVDEEVTSNLQLLTELPAQGAQSPKGRNLALLRTLGNLASEAFKWAARFAVDTLKDARKIATGFAAGGLVLVGLSLAETTIQYLAPVFPKAAELNWMPELSRFLQAKKAEILRGK